MRRRRKNFAILACLAASLIMLGVGAIYYGVRSSQKKASAEMLLNSQILSSGSSVGGPSSIPESKRREIYRRALLAAENIAEIDQTRRRDGVTPISAYETSLREAVASAIHRLALGNDVTEGDVLQIVREGSANNW